MMGIATKMKPRQLPHLICFDVDGTLVHHPDGLTIWEVLNLRFGGTPERNRRRYEMYLRGDISYARWVELDVGDWIAAGATRANLLEAIAEFELLEDARRTLAELRRRGYRLAVISGTLDILLDTVFPDHPFEEVYTNKVFFDDRGKLHAWEATRFDGRGKPVALREIASRRGIELERTAFVGDGDNDLPLLGVSGFFVAFHPRSDRLAQGADLVIQDDGLKGLLDVFIECEQDKQ